MTAAKPSTRMTPKGHDYYLDGEKVPMSVTGITGAGLPKPQLVDWASRESADVVLNRWDELVQMAPSERYEAVRGARFQTLGEAKERGTEVHTQIVRYLAGEPVVPPAGLEGHIDAAIKFVEEWRLAELLVEVPVFSREFNYAGRLDLLGRLIDGASWLLDFKTHAKGPFVESALQLAAYRYAEFYVVPGELDEHGRVIEHPMPAIDRAGIVHVRADGYDLYPYDAGPEAFVLFGAAQQIAEFTKSPREQWIGAALRPPAVPMVEPEDEAAA
jgi:hypothetical protein